MTSPIDNKQATKKGSVARKILFSILLFSSFATLLITCYQLYADYREQRGMVDERMVQIELSYRESLGNAIWFLDDTQIESILSGIMKFEDVHFISVQIADGENFTLGEQRQADNLRHYDVDVFYNTQESEVLVGHLIIESNLDGVIQRLSNKFWLILISQGVKTFFVSLFILFLINYFVTRHLQAISEFAAKLDIKDKANFLKLERKNETIPDELDQIALSINQTKQDLIEDAAELSTLKEQLELERDYLREEVETSGHFGEIIGNSKALKTTLSMVEAVAQTPASVLILGESGVGKEMIARAIHTKSKRADKPMIKVNCASIPNELFESEFFGHVKGSFTGAHQDRIGRLQLADGGTLFLDEVGEIPISQQGKLLRAIQEGEFERIGDNQTINVDVRVVAATNRNMENEIKTGRFREDLFYRLNVFPVNVPPLRERFEDILPLTLNFLDEICKELNRDPFQLSQSQVMALQKYNWPGNIRELRNTVERAVISSTGKKLRLDILRFDTKSISLSKQEETVIPKAEETLNSYLTHDEFKNLEKENIIAALKHAKWKTWGDEGAAILLGIKPSTLAYQMKTFGIKKPQK